MKWGLTINKEIENKVPDLSFTLQSHWDWPIYFQTLKVRSNFFLCFFQNKHLRVQSERQKHWNVFKDNNKDTPERLRRSDDFVSFKHNFHFFLVFLFLTLNMYLIAKLQRPKWHKNTLGVTFFDKKEETSWRKTCCRKFNSWFKLIYDPLLCLTH